MNWPMTSIILISIYTIGSIITAYINRKRPQYFMASGASAAQAFFSLFRITLNGENLEGETRKSRVTEKIIEECQRENYRRQGRKIPKHLAEESE